MDCRSGETGDHGSGFAAMGGKSPRRHRWSAADVHGSAMSELGHGRGELPWPLRGMQRAGDAQGDRDSAEHRKSDDEFKEIEKAELFGSDFYTIS